MRYGSQYFRPPHPAKENWQKDMQNMHTLGFNTVKLWAVWNTIERTEGSFDFSDLDELVRIAGSSGLAFYPQLCYYSVALRKRGTRR